VGGVPGREVVVEGVKGGKKKPARQNTQKQHRKQVISRTFWPKNHLKCHFSLKMNKIYSQDFFEEYINFKIFGYLKRCGVIPDQSFRCHIRPHHPD
jgi:hypothetical protein